MTRVRSLTLGAIGIFGMIGVQPAYASYPNMIGTWTSTDTAVASGCADSTKNGTSYPYTSTVNVNNQTDGSFGGTWVIDIEGGHTESGTFTGTVSPGGSWSASESGGDSITGTVSGDSGTYSYSNYDGGLQCTLTSNGAMARGAGNVPAHSASSEVVATPTTLGSQVRTYTGSIGVRAKTALRGPSKGVSLSTSGLRFQGETGLSAGDGTEVPLGVWGSYSRVEFENKLSTTASDGARNNLLVGVDTHLRDNVIIGFAAGYEFGDTDTKFNGGNIESKGITLAPYLAASVDDALTLDLTFGLSMLNHSQYRTLTGSGARITGDVDSRRIFFSGNLTRSSSWNRMLVDSRVGMLFASESFDDFIESDGTKNSGFTNTLAQLQAGVEATYPMGNYEPFAELFYNYDMTTTSQKIVTTGPTPSDDKDDFILGAGVRFFAKDNLTGVARLNATVGRDDVEEYVLSFDIRGEF